MNLCPKYEQQSLNHLDKCIAVINYYIMVMMGRSQKITFNKSCAITNTTHTVIIKSKQIEENKLCI